MENLEVLLAEVGWLRRLAGALVHDHDTADDLAQETIALALTQPPCESSGLRSWLRAVLHRKRHHL